MKKWFTFILAALVFVFLPLCSYNHGNSTPAESHLNQPETGHSHSSPSKLNKFVLAYYAVDYTGDMLSYDSLNSNYTWIDSIAIFNYLIDGRGNLIGQPYSQAVGLAKSRDIKSLMLVHNYVEGFSSGLAHQVLSVEENRSNLENNILSLIEEHGLDGVNIDLEGIPIQDREYYSIFLQELKEKFSPYGFLLSVSIPARTAEDIPNNWSGAYDYVRIGEIADLVAVMTYDEHWFGGAPGPIASLPWVERVLNYSVSQIPREKILLGIPAYGYDWSSDGECRSVSWNKAGELASENGGANWHDESSTPYITYYDKSGDKHETWFENESSLELKLDLANSSGVAGVAIWRLGFEDAGFWRTLTAKLS
ncbi:MAG: glycosyl hydrolase family 18 protein [Desulfotomaculaceae bacterium]|nr:glycosyl hydrolase family 18 protein [Desulfotomaculaceae bacterium]